MRRAFSEVVVCQTDLTLRDCIRAASVVKGRKWAGGELASWPAVRRHGLIVRGKVATIATWSRQACVVQISGAVGWEGPFRSGFVEPMRSQARTGFAVAAFFRARTVPPCTSSSRATGEIRRRSGASASRRRPYRPPSGTQRARYEGYLTKPKGAGPFPAVVLLHSCLGLPSDRQAIGTTLAGWGYVALFVDDFATRGLRDTCSVDFPEGLADALGGLAYPRRPALCRQRRGLRRDRLFAGRLHRAAARLARGSIRRAAMRPT